MKKILGVIGSPRKNGNTHVLVSRILDGARDMGADTEALFLGEHKILECDGCHACWKGKRCSKSDDMRQIYRKIIESDVIVFGTPVYWYGPTALMKCFIDRFVFFNCPENRRKIEKKKAVIVVPFEENHVETSDLLVRFFEKTLNYLEVELSHKVLVPGVTKRGEVKNKKNIMEKCYRLGQKLGTDDKRVRLK